MQLPWNNSNRNLSICSTFRERRFWQSKTHGLPKKGRRCLPLLVNIPREDGRSGRREVSNLVSALLQFDATEDEQFLEIGRKNTVEKMAPHLTHIGVHDHGFNNVSTYGNLRRMILEGRIPHNEWELHFYELALKVSSAVCRRVAGQKQKMGKVIFPSFNGPHSLFADTIRSLRSLALGHSLGHLLMGENDQSIPLLERLLHHSETTAAYNVYYGEGRDAFDVRRTCCT